MTIISDSDSSASQHSVDDSDSEELSVDDPFVVFTSAALDARARLLRRMGLREVVPGHSLQGPLPDHLQAANFVQAAWARLGREAAGL